jgi:hypothetical protein
VFVVSTDNSDQKALEIAKTTKKHNFKGYLEFVAWVLHLLLSLPLKIPLVGRSSGSGEFSKDQIQDAKCQFKILWLDLAPLLRPVLNIVMCFTYRHSLFKVCFQ